MTTRPKHALHIATTYQRAGYMETAMELARGLLPWARRIVLEQETNE